MNYCGDTVRPPPPALLEPCREWRKCSERDAEVEVKLSNVLPKLIGETFNDFTESLALKSLATLGGLCCMVVCGTCCSGFLKTKLSGNGKQNIVIKNERERKKKKSKKDASSSSDDSTSSDEEERRRRKKERKRMNKQRAI